VILNLSWIVARLRGEFIATKKHCNDMPVKLGYPHIESTAAGTFVFQSWTLGSDHR